MVGTLQKTFSKGECEYLAVVLVSSQKKLSEADPDWGLSNLIFVQKPKPRCFLKIQPW
jgi:hypothetical protein